jgi:hypothetical protein
MNSYTFALAAWHPVVLFIIINNTTHRQQKFLLVLK